MLNLLSNLPSSVVLGLIWSIMALGVFISYKVLDIPDLTVDGSFATGGAVCAMVIFNGGSFWIGMLAGFIAGALCGLITGLLHTFLGIPPILAGILTQLALYSINYQILGGRSNRAISRISFDLFVTRSDYLSALWKVGIIVVLIIVALYALFGTQLGASIRATGNNPKMSRAQGINTKFNVVLGLMISNALVAFSGAIIAQYYGAGDVDYGRGAIVVGLCAIVIGGAITKHISPNFLVRMVGVAFGAVIYYAIFQTITSTKFGSFRFDSTLLKLISAVVIALFLGVPYVYRKYFPSKKRKEKAAKGE